MNDEEGHYRGVRIAPPDRESQPRYADDKDEGHGHNHHPSCRIPHDARARGDRGGKERVDVGLQRDFEPIILTQCGMKVLKCCLSMHWSVCFEMKGKCFFPNKN